MNIPLLAHVNGDSDIIEAWLAHHLALGVTAFHLILMGPEKENRRLLALRDSYPIVVQDSYAGPFFEREKVRRLNALARDFHGQWVVVVDSDEFLELPTRTLPTTVQALERLGSTCLAAPLLQRLRADGSLDTPEEIPDPFREFPLCSVSLYQRMGSDGLVSKYPLFRCQERTAIHFGNHWPPNGEETPGSPLLGVSHHFKWRRPVAERIRRAIQTRDVHNRSYVNEAVAYLTYLERNGARLPLDDAFLYSREELSRRGLLQAMSWHMPATYRLRNWAKQLPPPIDRWIRAAYRSVRARS